MEAHVHVLQFAKREKKRLALPPASVGDEALLAVLPHAAILGSLVSFHANGFSFLA